MTPRRSQMAERVIGIIPREKKGEVRRATVLLIFLDIQRNRPDAIFHFVELSPKISVSLSPRSFTAKGTAAEESLGCENER